MIGRDYSTIKEEIGLIHYILTQKLTGQIIMGIILSFSFVILLLTISTLLSKKSILSKEGTRKFIHIGVSNWWIIAMIFFDGWLFASIAPAVFILLNYLSYRFTVIKAMERGAGRGDLGTVYFPISLLVLVLFTFSSLSHPYVGAIGILVMGYGDGLAAVIGKRFGKLTYHIAGNEKSYLGSLTMFVVSFIVTTIILSAYAPTHLVIPSLVIASAATFIEAFSPFGLDNLTVPILTSLLYQILFYR